MSPKTAAHARNLATRPAPSLGIDETLTLVSFQHNVMFPAASANTTIRAYNCQENPSKAGLMLVCARRLVRLDFPAGRHLEVSSVALTQARGMITASQQQTKPTVFHADALAGNTLPKRTAQVLVDFDLVCRRPVEWHLAPMEVAVTRTDVPIPQRWQRGDFQTRWQGLER